jgi:hypothetical protein
LKQTTNEAFSNAKSCKLVKTSPFELVTIINEKKQHGKLTLKSKSSTLQDQNERNCKITSTQKKLKNQHNKEGKES